MLQILTRNHEFANWSSIEALSDEDGLLFELLLLKLS